MGRKGQIPHNGKNVDRCYFNYEILCELYVNKGMTTSDIGLLANANRHNS